MEWDRNHVPTGTMKVASVAKVRRSKKQSHKSPVNPDGILKNWIGVGKHQRRVAVVVKVAQYSMEKATRWMCTLAALACVVSCGEVSVLVLGTPSTFDHLGYLNVRPGNFAELVGSFFEKESDARHDMFVIANEHKSDKSPAIALPEAVVCTSRTNPTSIASTQQMMCSYQQIDILLILAREETSPLPGKGGLL